MVTPTTGEASPAVPAPPQPADAPASERLRGLVFLIWVVCLTAFDLFLRHRSILSWDRSDQRQYLICLAGSVLFWWAAFRLMGNLARRGPVGWLFFAVLGVALTLSVWTAFAVFFHYGTFPNQDMVVFLANAPGMVFDVMPHIASIRDSLMLIGIGVAIAIGARWGTVRRRGLGLGILLPLVTLLELGLFDAFADVSPGLPLTSEANTVRFTTQLLRWHGAPPPFFKLHQRNPAPLPPGIAAKPGNFDYLWVVGESMGARYFKAYGAEQDYSPRLDAILEDPAVIRLEHLDSNSTCTDVSVPSLMSGIDPTDPMAKLVASNLPYDVMKARGYGTFLVSSHKLTWAYLSLFLGDRSLDLMQGAEWLHPHPPDNFGAPDTETYDAAFREMDRMDAEGKKFFGVVHVRTLHTPYQVDPDGPPPPVEATPSVPSARYQAAMGYFDRMFGGFWDDLKKRPYSDHTIVIFLADHGESFGQHGYYTHCGRYFDEETHVPSFIYAPPAAWQDPEMGPRLTQIRANRELRVSAIDVLPTFLDLAGVNPDAFSKQLDGQSLTRAIDVNRRYTISNCADFRRCPVKMFAFCQNNIKYIYNGTSHEWSAFDEIADPTEQNDIAAAHQSEIAAASPELSKSRVLAELLRTRGRPSGNPLSTTTPASTQDALTPTHLHGGLMDRQRRDQPNGWWK